MATTGNPSDLTMKIYTKTGDKGETALFGGQRVSKGHLRVEAYGTVDELNACLGVARAAGQLPFDTLLETIQSTLFELGAELATPPSRERRPSQLDDRDIELLENAIDEHESALEPLTSFILPGGTPAAAALHLARTVCRRAERFVVTLRNREPETSEVALRYLNRVGDLLFVLARRANAVEGHGDVPWRSRERDAR